MGTENTVDIVRMGNMVDLRINWCSVQQKVANHLHNMRDLMKRGEGQQIIVIKVGSMSRDKEHLYRRENQ